MIVRHRIVCSTCKSPITTRVSVGHNPCQEHAFLCPHCNEAIALGMKVDSDSVTYAMEHVENCSAGDAEGPIVNLEPHFVLDKGEQYSDRRFPWMQQAEYIRKTAGLEPPDLPKGVDGPVVLDVYNEFGGVTDITEAWRIVEKGWSLLRNGRNDLAQEVLEKFRKFDYSGEISLDPILYHFCQLLLFPKGHDLMKSGGKLLFSTYKLNQDELLRFREFYIAEWKSEHFDRFHETFRDFFRHYSEYDQIILYVKNGVPVPDGCVATSSGFDDTWMFYGNTYENYTSNIATLACLHNISMGRRFDTFETMDLKKYLTINKANRGNPFKGNQLLAPYLACLDSELRNASHHRAARATADRTMIEYRSGGTGQRQEISYSKYLERCGQIALSSAALLTVELLLCLPPTGE